jgi:hypothetical protein
VARSSLLLTFDFWPFALRSLLEACSLRLATCDLQLFFVFPKNLITFKPLKTKNKTAYVTTFKQQPQQQKPQPSGGYQTPEKKKKSVITS